jgi:soluble lytic murein transglycosylase-like protein
MRRTRSSSALLIALALASVSWNVTPVEPAPARVAVAGVTRPATTAPDAALALAVADQLARQPTGLFPAEIERLAATLVGEARARDFDPWLVLALIRVESGFHNFATSPVGALGLMQILPSTGEALARRLEIPWRGAQTLFDPVANVKLGVAYLQELRDRFGHLPTALAAYNWGPGRIGRRVRDGSPVPARYARRVLSAYAESARLPIRTS